jgi:hypothetical protein
VKLDTFEKIVKTVATLTKDLGLIALGMWGIWHQEHTGEVRGELLIVYTVILGIPTATNVLALLHGSRRTSDDDTTLQRSESLGSSSLPGSGSSSSRSLGDEPITPSG